MAAAAGLNIFVAGGNSNTGAATIQALLKSHPNVTITAGVRDMKKAVDKFPGADSKRLTFVEHDVKDGKLPTKTADTPELKGFNTLVLVPPQVYQDRIGFVSAYIKDAKAAGVKHIVVRTPDTALRFASDPDIL